MPAIRDDIADMIINRKYPQLVSFTICLEDSIRDEDIHIAELTLIENLRRINTALSSGQIEPSNMPFIFIRVRTPEHLLKIASYLSDFSQLIAGFVFPKFDLTSGPKFLDAFDTIRSNHDHHYYFMPILESEEIVYVEKRRTTLESLKLLLEPYKQFVLNIRIGSTDFCSIFGIRRGKDYTVYEIQIIRDCITDILNFFSRYEQNYIVSGSVWEYFDHNNRFLKPLLRATPFTEHLGERGLDLRTKLIELNLDGLIKEILEDKVNGIIGKTVIHPSHVVLVNSLYVVTHEEYVDALEILDKDLRGGVIKSRYNNKMNEIKPHTLWAKKILMRSKVYGVFNENYDCLALISQKLLND